MLTPTDIDLLRLEPRLFVDAASAATMLRSGSDGITSGTTFSSAGSDFAAAGIDAGHVIVVGAEVVEVEARQSATSLHVSRPRADDSQDAIDPTPGMDQTFSVPTFERIASQETAWTLGALGIDARHPEHPLDESAVTNAADLRRYVALRVIARGFERAAAGDPGNLALAGRAAHWRAIEQSARHLTAVFLDLDGDGVPDATRRIDDVMLTRG